MITAQLHNKKVTKTDLQYTFQENDRKKDYKSPGVLRTLQRINE